MFLEKFKGYSKIRIFGDLIKNQRTQIIRIYNFILTVTIIDTHWALRTVYMTYIIITKTIILIILSTSKCITLNEPSLFFFANPLIIRNPYNLFTVNRDFLKKKYF